MQNEIIKLKQENPTWGYKKIANIIGCSPNTVKYYLDPQEKQKVYLRGCKTRKTINHILKRKKDNFNCEGGYLMRKEAKKRNPSLFTAKELKSKILQNPKCYLTGDNIDLLDAKSFEFDHIIPRSKNGTNTLDNCGLTIKDANRAKSDMTLDDFINLCKKVLTNHGYSVVKI
jgi:CRISPR/Cas system Type II protein with McrA/HNH and RuvC-like nuclease domain